MTGTLLAESRRRRRSTRDDSQVVELHVQRGGAWQSLGEAKLDPDAWAATFRVPSDR